MRKSDPVIKAPFSLNRSSATLATSSRCAGPACRAFRKHVFVKIPAGTVKLVDCQRRDNNAGRDGVDPRPSLAPLDGTRPSRAFRYSVFANWYACRVSRMFSGWSKGKASNFSVGVHASCSSSSGVSCFIGGRTGWKWSHPRRRGGDDFAHFLQQYGRTVQIHLQNGLDWAPGWGRHRRRSPAW